MTALAQFLGSDGVTTISSYTFPDLLAGAHSRPVKFGYKSLSDRVLVNVQELIQAIVGNDGATMVFMASEPTTLSSPWGFAGSATAPGSGGTFGAIGTYGFKITALNAAGESGPSSEITVAITATTQTIVLTWVQTPGATGYKIFRTATPGTYTTPTLLTTIGAGATVTFTDTGGAVSAGVPATTNTTAGWALTATLSGAGAGGVWAGIGVEFWTVVALDASGNQLAQSAEATLNVNDVTKKVTLGWAAITGAVTYQVWRALASQTYTTPALVATLGVVTTYDDTGTGTLPGTLTGAPTFGQPPAVGTFSQNPIVVGNVAIGEEEFFWVILEPPLGTPEVGNPRLALVIVKET